VGAVFLFIPRRGIEKSANFAGCCLPLRALNDSAAPGWKLKTIRVLSWQRGAAAVLAVILFDRRAYGFGKFESHAAKRLLQHNRHKSDLTVAGMNVR
jgi:hypothetical protein